MPPAGKSPARPLSRPSCRFSLVLLVLGATGLFVFTPRILAGAAAPAETSSTPAADRKATRLERLKHEFPSHTAGPMSDQTDPEVGECFFRYKRLVEALSLDRIEDQLEDLRGQVVSDIRYLATLNAGEDDTTPPALRLAHRQNEAWLKNKLKPLITQWQAWPWAK